MPREIQCTRGKVAVVDDNDFDRLDGRTWQSRLATRTKDVWYAQTMIRRNDGSFTTAQMHRIIMGAKPGQLVDHVNWNGLDNRRVNLRICSPSQSSAHTRRRRPVLSGLRGVYWDKGSWKAEIYVQNCRYPLGRFACQVKAAHAYDSAARDAFGPFAVLNFPSSGDGAA